MKAYTFELPDQDGTIHKLSDYSGKWVIVYFYPKDDTPGCTKEACNFRDNIGEYTKRNVTVIGISKDSVASHKKFADKFGLPFTLLADPDKKVIKLYNTWQLKKFMGREYMGIIRSSFLIDKKGKIQKIYETVKPQAHAQEVISDLKTYK